MRLNRQQATDQIARVLAGEEEYKSLPDALQSAIRLPIYNLACNVLAQPTQAARRAVLDSMPDMVRDLVETEALRLHKLRRK